MAGQEPVLAHLAGVGEPGAGVGGAGGGSAGLVLGREAHGGEGAVEGDLLEGFGEGVDLVAVVDRVQIAAEEAALRERFGDDYEAYLAAVPRWLDLRSFQRR